MRLKYQWWRGLMAAVLGGLMGVTVAGAAGEQFLPVLGVREGAVRGAGIPQADGFIAYVTLLNERDGGINGVKLVWEECETVYDVDRGVECYERLKTKGPTGAAAFQPFSTPIIYALLERATHEQFPLLTVGLGRSDASDGRVFPYVFNPPVNYWSQNTAKIRFIGQRVGGMEQLKGRKIAHVYADNDYGRETLLILDQQAAQYDFAVQHLAVQPPGLDQKATWLRIKVAQPDWVILRSNSGVMTITALKEAAQIGVPRDKIVGNWWACSEQDMVPAGEAALGYICATFHATGTDFPLIQDVLKYVYTGGKGPGPESDVGTAYWIRGMLSGFFTTEAIRRAMREFGNQPLTGAQVQWGLEHLTITPAYLKEIGAEGLIQPLTLSCRDHEGGREREVPAVGRHEVDGHHRLDCAGSGAGAAPGGGVSGQVCAGEGDPTAGLPIDAPPWVCRRTPHAGRVAPEAPEVVCPRAPVQKCLILLVKPVQGKDTVWGGVSTSIVDFDGAITQGRYMQCKGVVQGNVVILEEGISLPDGARVTVTVEQAEQQESAEVTHEELAQRRLLGERMRAFSQRLAGRHVNLGDLVMEGREELEDRA